MLHTEKVERAYVALKLMCMKWPIERQWKQHVGNLWSIVFVNTPVHNQSELKAQKCTVDFRAVIYCSQ